MLKYIAKRIGLALITIFTVATLTFFLMNMVPGGPFLSEKAVSPAAQAALEAKYGLDKPLSQQYLTYMKDALHGDFGESLKQRGRTVTSIYSIQVPCICKSRWTFRYRSAVGRYPSGMSGSYPSWQDAGQRDLRDLHLWYCGTKLRYMYSASVFPGK